MNVHARNPAAPKLDPQRAFLIRAVDALIDQTLSQETSGSSLRGAMRFLQQLAADDLAKFHADSATGAIRMSLLGITSAPTLYSAPAILRLWQSAARDRLALSA